MKTKKLFFKTAATLCMPVAFLMVSTLATPVAAQVIVAATHVDNVVGQYGMSNTASIDYTPNCTSLTCAGTPNLQLTAIVEGQGIGGAAPVLYLNDQYSGWVATALPMPSDFQPDVIIGNDITTPSQYIVGVVGINSTNSDVYLLTYSVSGEGTGALTINLTGTYNISSSSNAYTSPAHIDIEAQYSTPFLAGQPTCNNFTITWVDSSLAGGIMGYTASLNNPTSGTPTVINPGHITLMQPDVAMVERLNPLTNMFEDWALFGYISLAPIPQKLLYQEWNIAAAPSAAIVYDNTHNYLPYGYTASAVRIDAIDDFNHNQPGPGVYPGTPPATNAFFDMVVAYGIVGPSAEVLEFNNILGTFASTNITLPVAALSGNVNLGPVTCGPGRFYSVGYFSGPGAGIGNTGCYSTPVDWATGTTTTSNNAYALNSLAWAPSPSPLPGAVALGATCNTEKIGIQKLCAVWENANNLYEKYTGTVPYAFRQNPSQTAIVVNGDQWLLSPNPATDVAVLSAPAGFSASDGDRYHITDLSGRELLHGNISAAAQEISVTGLPAGMYLLSVHTSATENKVIKFVKE